MALVQSPPATINFCLFFKRYPNQLIFCTQGFFDMENSNLKEFLILTTGRYSYDGTKDLVFKNSNTGQLVDSDAWSTRTVGRPDTWPTGQLINSGQCLSLNLSLSLSLSLRPKLKD